MITSVPDRTVRALFIVLHCLIWWLMIVLAKPGLDNYGDMAEVYGWSQHWLMGSDKHPQFLPWATRIWFSIMPRAVWSFYLLSALNLAVGLFGVVAFARRAGLASGQVWLALVLQVLAFPYLTLADKLNMNAILLAIWPWVAWAFLGAIHSKGRRQLFWAAGCGALLAVAILSKYYSVILTPGLLLVSLLPGVRRIWRGGAVPVALIVAAICLLPHVLWLGEHGDALAYAGSQGEGGIVWREIAIFALSPLLYWLIPFCIAVPLLWKRRPLRAPAMVIWVLALSPWVMTLVAGVSGRAELSLPWAIPIGFGFTALIAAMLHPEHAEAAVKRMRNAFRIIWPAMLVLGLTYSFVNGRQGEIWHYTPQAEAALAMADIIESEYPGVEPEWVSAQTAAANYAFYAPGDVMPLAGRPDNLPSFVPPYPGWQTHAGIVLCGLSRDEDVGADCQAEAASWAARNGLQSADHRLTLRRQGWRWPHDIPFTAAFTLVWPETAGLVE